MFEGTGFGRYYLTQDEEGGHNWGQGNFLKMIVQDTEDDYTVNVILLIISINKEAVYQMVDGVQQDL